MTLVRVIPMLALFGFSGCSYAGPFVTSVSSDGNGGLIIEKSMIEFNAFLGTVSNHKATTTTVYLGIDRATTSKAPSQLDRPAEWRRNQTAH